MRAVPLPLLLLLLLLLYPALATAALQVLPTPSIGRDAPHCRESEKQLATATRPAVPRKLGDLPSANQYLAVDRHVGGCRVPILASAGIGNRSPTRTSSLSTRDTPR